jgi:hypothetical protein
MPKGWGLWDFFFPNFDWPIKPTSLRTEASTQKLAPYRTYYWRFDMDHKSLEKRTTKAYGNWLLAARIHFYWAWRGWESFRTRSHVGHNWVIYFYVFPTISNIFARESIIDGENSEFST